MTDKWELRSSRRWGSEWYGYFYTREAAEAEARRVIAATGSVGRIECVLEEEGVVYFDQYEEDS